MKQTAHKAWAAAAAGLVIAALNVLAGFIANGQADPVLVEQLGTSVGVFVDAVVMAVVGYLTVWFAPANKPVDE